MPFVPLSTLNTLLKSSRTHIIFAGKLSGAEQKSREQEILETAIKNF